MKLTERKIVECIPRLRRYARVLFKGNMTAADDLVQDCVERALSQLSKWRPESDLRAWLFTIMHNLYVNQVRREVAGPNMVVMDEESLTGGKDNADQGLILRDLQKALDALAPDQKEILLLVTLERMTYRDVAKLMEIPEGTVMSRLSRARKRLRQTLSGEATQNIRRIK